ncbi:MAG: thioredoxin family protein [Flavisolibacter sp.]
MKAFLLLYCLSFHLLGASPWLHDLGEAKALSKEKHQLILLNFSGSDWCSGCIKMDKEIFGSAVFQEFADQHLVLLNADFPRSRKNSLPKELQKNNEALAEKYNGEGVFPFTVLLDSDGTVLKKWSGYYEKGAENFINEIKTLDARSDH